MFNLLLWQIIFSLIFSSYGSGVRKCLNVQQIIFLRKQRLDVKNVVCPNEMDVKTVVCPNELDVKNVACPNELDV